MSLGCAYLLVFPESKGPYAAQETLYHWFPTHLRTSFCSSAHQVRGALWGPRADQNCNDSSPSCWSQDHRATKVVGSPDFHQRSPIAMPASVETAWITFRSSTGNNISYPADTNPLCYAEPENVTNGPNQLFLLILIIPYSDAQLFWGQTSHSDTKWMLAKCYTTDIRYWDTKVPML